MAEGTDNVEDRLSCDDSSYSERNLEVYNSGNGINSGSEDEEYGGGDTISHATTEGLSPFCHLHTTAYVASLQLS